MIFLKNVLNGQKNMDEKFKINSEECEQVVIGQKKNSHLMIQ